MSRIILNPRARGLDPVRKGMRMEHCTIGTAQTDVQ